MKDFEMPQKCDGCKFEDRFGGCVLLNCIGNDHPIEEFDEEWRKARKEGRRLKYCPLKEECDLLAVIKTENSRYIDAEKLIGDLIFSSKEFERVFKEIINDAPTADVEEVTRCKDCAYCVGLFICDKNEDQIWRCQRFGLNMIGFDGYCSWAKRYNGLDKEKEE